MCVSAEGGYGLYTVMRELFDGPYAFVLSSIYKTVSYMYSSRFYSTRVCVCMWGVVVCVCVCLSACVCLCVCVSVYV